MVDSSWDSRLLSHSAGSGISGRVVSGDFKKLQVFSAPKGKSEKLWRLDQATAHINDRQ
jgi:hypothetical protein